MSSREIPHPLQSPPRVMHMSTSSSSALVASGGTSIHEAIVHLPASSSGILVAPFDPLSQRPRAKKRVSIDIHVPIDLSPPYARKMTGSMSSDRVSKRYPGNTKDIQGRFKNRRKSGTGRRPKSENLEMFESADEEEEEDETKEIADIKPIRKPEVHKKSPTTPKMLQRRPSTLNPRRSVVYHNKEDIKIIKRKRDRSRESRSSSSSNLSGFSLFRGQNSKTYLIQSPKGSIATHGSITTRSSSKSRGSRRIVIPAEALPEKVWARKNIPVDLLDYNTQYGQPNILIIPAIVCILTGMALLVAAVITSGETSKRLAVYGCGILSSGGILMIISLCWYYVKSKCLYGDDDLAKIRKMSSQVLPMKRIMSLSSSGKG